MVEAIKEGFRVINRNLPLVLIQIGVMIISFLFFIFFVGVPVAIAVIYLGIDLAGFKEAIATLKDPIEFFYRYPALTIFLVISFLLYLIAVTSLAIFAFGGSLGVVKESLRNPSERFSFRKFLSDGKRYFMPLCVLCLILGILFIALVFVFGTFVGGAIVLLTPYKDEMGLFLIAFAILSALILLSLAFIGFILLLAFSLYAVIAMIVEELKAGESLKRAMGFMKSNFFEATGFYLLLIAGYIIAVIIMALANFPFNIIPILGPILTLPFQLVTSIVQLYLGLVMIASLVVFYMRKAIR